MCAKTRALATALGLTAEQVSRQAVQMVYFLKFYLKFQLISGFRMAPLAVRAGRQRREAAVREWRDACGRLR